MPRQSQKRLKGQKRVHEQDSFDFTAPRVRPAARPVDAYVARPQDRSADNLKKFVGQLENIGQRGGNLAVAKQAEDRKAGMTSAMRGEEAPEDANWAFIEGHEKFRGEADTLQYRKEMSELYRTGWQMAPDEWRDAKEEINQKFLQDKSDAYIQGFVPGAMDIETQFDGKFANAKQEIVVGEFKTDVRSAATEKMHRVLNDETLKKGDGAKQLRASLSAMQEAGKQRYGLSRQEVTDEFLEAIGEQAVRGGRPDLLNFALVPDKDGHKLMNRPETADKLNQYIDQAVARRDSMEAAARKKEEKLQEEVNDSIEKAIILSNDYEDYTSARDILEKNIDKLSPARIQVHLNAINKLESEEGWPTVSNPRDYQNFYNLAVVGEMEADDWQLAQGYVTKPEYKELMKTQQAFKKAQENSTEGKAAATARFKEYKNMTVKMVAPSDEIGRFLDRNGGDRAAFVQHQWNILLESHTKDPEKYPLGLRDYFEWVGKIKTAALDQFPMDTDDVQTAAGSQTIKPESGTPENKQDILSRLSQTK